MKKFKQNKLWRDKTIENLEKQGSKIHWHILELEQFQQELKKKLLEEANEIVAAKNNDELISEIADVLEVIDEIAKSHGFTEKQILLAKESKRNERGRFTTRQYVTFAEHPIGSDSERYCLASPDKYPEII